MVTEGFTSPSRGYSAETQALRETWGQDWLWLCYEWPRKLRQAGGDFRGFSFCAKPNEWLLSVRVVRDGIPEVVFVNKKDPTGCVSTLRRKENEGTLHFFVDRFA